MEKTGNYEMPAERLTEAEIRRFMKRDDLSLIILQSVDSTNNEAKRYALSGGAAPAGFVAEEQTAGRGRMGRSFYSPGGTGLYVSFLYPVGERTQESVVGITSAAAVALLRAVHRVCGMECRIKWVNDLQNPEGKKLAGILAESFFAGAEKFVVIGIGVNLSTENFPDEISGRAASIGAGKLVRCALCGVLADELTGLWEALPDRGYMAEYRRASCVLGKPVCYTQNGVSRFGVAEEIDDEGGLWIAGDDGKRVRLASGEISLRVTGNLVGDTKKGGELT